MNVLFFIFFNNTFLRPKCFYDFECALSNPDDRHFLQNPFKLDCHHCVCKECIPEKEKTIICSFCGLITERDLRESKFSKEKESHMEENYGQLFIETKERFKSCYDKIKGKITRSLFLTLSDF